MKLVCKCISIGTTTGFICLYGVYSAHANWTKPRFEPSQVEVNPRLQFGFVTDATLNLESQDLTAQDLTAQNSTAADLVPPAEPLVPLDSPDPEPVSPVASPPSTPDDPDKPAQLPANLDELLSSPDRLTNPTRPEEVRIENVRPITLRQAIDLAWQNSRQLQIAKTQLDRSRALLRESQAAWFPTVGFQGSYSQDLSASGQLSTDVAREQAASQIPQAQTQLDQLLSQPSASNPLDQLIQALSIQQAQSQLAAAQTSLQDLDNFATRTFNGTFAINYTLFTSGQRPALVRAAAEQTRISELEVERVTEQVRLDVTQAYYDVQQADQQLVIQAAAVKEATKSLSDAQALLEAALATRLDVLNAQVQLDNATQQLTQTQSQQAIALRRLAQLLSLPATVSVTPVEPIEITERWNLTLEESIVRALRYRVELKQQLSQRKASQQQRRAAIAAQLPQLAAFLNYNLLDLQTDQPGEFVTKGFATGYSLGLRLQWTFFDGGITSARIAQQNANIQLAEIQFAQTAEQVRFDVEQAYFNLQSNLQSVQLASTALERARDALRIARLRFQAGVGTQLDVLNAETNLTRAEGNLLNAILGYNRALASLKRAVSSLPPVSPSN